jgi:hypothetical protein
LEAAIPEAVEACGAVIGDPNQIGQAPETDAGIQQYVRTKAVPEPKYDPKKPVGAMDADIEAWVADGLVRDLAGVGAGDSLV